MIMEFRETRLAGAYVVEILPKSDHRGFFARTFCAYEFEAHGLHPTVAQCNIVSNYVRGTIRGMHYQVEPSHETKLVRCTRGAILDVIVDLRPDSPTYLEHVALELTDENRRALYVPERFAHGYQTLTDDAEVTYLMGDFYTPGLNRGLRYSDPRLGIDWPIDTAVISERDASWPLLAPAAEPLLS
jgi:dTDP-4-dehydrorhamnose 3,5-epimerase